MIERTEDMIINHRSLFNAKIANIFQKSEKPDTDDTTFNIERYSNVKKKPNFLLDIDGFFNKYIKDRGINLNRIIKFDDDNVLALKLGKNKKGIDIGYMLKFPGLVDFNDYGKGKEKLFMLTRDDNSIYNVIIFFMNDPNLVDSIKDLFNAWEIEIIDKKYHIFISDRQRDFSVEIDGDQYVFGYTYNIQSKDNSNYGFIKVNLKNAIYEKLTLVKGHDPITIKSIIEYNENEKISKIQKEIQTFIWGYGYSSIDK